jgi:hypothetical protein
MTSPIHLPAAQRRGEAGNLATVPTSGLWPGTLRISRRATPSRTTSRQVRP